LQLCGVTVDMTWPCSAMADTSHDGRRIVIMPRSHGVTVDAWHGGRHAVVVWHVGGHTPAMSHGSGRAKVVVGVRWRSHHVVVAAWHGSGRRLHGLVVVVAVMSWQLRHGGGGGGGDSSHIMPRWPHGMAGSHITWWWWWRPCGGGGGGSCVTPWCSCEGGGDVACSATRHTATWRVQQ
jgi:hypothetical protein